MQENLRFIRVMDAAWTEYEQLCLAEMYGRQRDAALSKLSREIVADIRGRAVTPRADHQAGRNDPCPCGSGVKFKRCCKDKRAAVTA